MTQKHILVLDDEPWQVSWIKPLARAHGWEVEYAENYFEAEKMFEQLAPEIVVVDVRIGEDAPPRKGATLEGVEASWIGLRFVRHLRLEKNSKAFIFVYSGVDREELRRTVEDGFQAKFCSKFDSAFFEAKLIATMKKLGSK